MKFYFAIEFSDGNREFGNIEAVDFDMAFIKIDAKGGNILSISNSSANVMEDVYCQDHDC